MSDAKSVQYNNRLRLRSFFVQIVFVLTLFLYTSVDAASIYLTPTQAQVAIGETVRMKVMVNTQGVAINTVGGVLKFDPNELEIVSVNKLNSILNIWIEEPSFSNSAGAISFDGGITTPGYTGGAGEVFTFTAKAKKSSVSSLRFDDVSILKNDGVGTEVLSSEGSATVTVGKPGTTPKTAEDTKTPTAKPVEVEPTKKIVSIPPGAPVLSSVTHPDQNKWYTDRVARVSWEKKLGAGIQTIFDSKPDTKATGQIQYGVSQKVLQGVRDGISYLHVRYVGTNTVSETAHFAIHVDTTAPSSISATSTINEVGNQIVTISAVDIHAGLDYAEVFLDDSTVPTRVAFENAVFTYPVPAGIKPGEHTLRVKIFDMAGNNTEYTYPLNAVERPVFTIEAKPVEVEVGNELHISATSSLVNTPITIFIKSPNAVTKSFPVITSEIGSVASVVIVDDFGLYEVWAQVPNIGETNHITVKAFSTWKSQTLSWIKKNIYICLGVLGFLIVILSIGLLRYSRRGVQKACLRKISKLESSASAAYIELQSVAKNQVKYLERLAEVRDLTDQEKLLYKKSRSLLE